MGLYGAGLYGAGVYGAAVAVVATQDSAWPPRVLVEVTGLNDGDVVTIYRVVAGARTPIRGGDTVTLMDTAIVVNDGEYPFGSPVTYTVNVNGADTVSSATTSWPLPGDKVVLSDAITGLSAEVVISTWPEKDNQRQGTRFFVGGRNVAVLSPRGGTESTAEFFTETDTSRAQVTALLNACTSGIILLRIFDSVNYAGYDGWYAVMGDTEVRWKQDGTSQKRLWTLDLLEVDPWSSALLASGWALADIQTVYAGQTLADLAGDFGLLLDLEVYDWGSA